MTVDHSWVSDSIRCAIARLSGKPYDPVGQRGQYDAILSLNVMEHNWRINQYWLNKKGRDTSTVPTSTLDQLLQDIQQTP